jgi:hypothetical protein
MIPERKSFFMDLYFRHQAFSSLESIDLKFSLIY